MKRFVLFLLIIAVLSPVFAGSVYYDSGDTDFCIRLGSDFPLLVAFPNAENKSSDSYKGFGRDEGKTGLSAGVTGALSYQAFLNSYFSIGGELGYSLNFTRVKDHYYTQVPITFKASYIPLQTGKFDVQINANVGYDYIKFTNDSDEVQSSSALYSRLTVQPTYYFGKSWGIGVESGLIGVFELHTKTKKDSNAICLTVPASLVLSYRH